MDMGFCIKDFTEKIVAASLVTFLATSGFMLGGMFLYKFRRRMENRRRFLECIRMGRTRTFDF